MMNSPTMCQYYVPKALEPVTKQFPNFLVIHYMDAILFSAPSILNTEHMFDIANYALKTLDESLPLKKFKPLHHTITWGSLLIGNALLPN